TCNNPVLNRSLDEWGSIRGSAPVREAVADHQSARYAYVQPNNTVLDPSFYLPQQPVQPDERWTFGYDTAATRAGRARVEVDWYSTPAGDNSGYLGHANGSWTSLPGGAGWTRVAADFTAPPNAVRANVLTDHEYTATGALLRATACDYRIGPAGSASATPSAPTPPTPTEPTPTAPTPTEPGPTGPAPTTPAPPQGSTEAAVKFGWGAPQPISDEFSQPGPVDPRKWEVPDGNEGGTAGCWPGHQGNGRRCAKNNSVANGILTLTGEANGDTGWLEQKLDRRYGRWEIRSRSRNTGTSGGLYHVLHLIWPTSNNRFVDGEYDWVEYSNPDGQCLAAFLHYPKSPNDDKVHREHCPVDMTQWHNYAFEWTPKALVGYVDGVEWFRLTGGAGPGGRADIQAMPSGHLTIQLDNFTGDGGLRPAVFEVDWVRVYP
ncbi:MAG TPA: glycoside hydrolase family 16 protein, partial [Catenuloplanes sp.]